MRDEALRKTYESIAHRVQFSVDEFIAALQDWQVTPVHDGGEVIGGLLVKKNEMHVGFSRPPRASVRRYIREFLNQIIGLHGFAITTIQPQNSAGLRFCQRLGFVKVGEVNGAILLRCDRSNYT